MLSTNEWSRLAVAAVAILTLLATVSYAQFTPSDFRLQNRMEAADQREKQIRKQDPGLELDHQKRKIKSLKSEKSRLKDRIAYESANPQKDGWKNKIDRIDKKIEKKQEKLEVAKRKVIVQQKLQKEVSAQRAQGIPDAPRRPAAVRQKIAKDGPVTVAKLSAAKSNLTLMRPKLKDVKRAPIIRDLGKKFILTNKIPVQRQRARQNVPK